MWQVRKDGRALTAEDAANMCVVIAARNGKGQSLPFEIVEGKIVAVWYGIKQTEVGDYRLTAWYNKGKIEESVVDVVWAVTLSRYTNEETYDELDAETIELEGGNLQFAVIQGESAYQVAVDNGFEGTETEWLQSLKQPALDAAQTANEAAQLANEKAGAANDAAALANEKAGLANNKAELAEQKAGYAQDKGDYAKEQGDYAKGEIDGAKGDFPTLNDRFNHVDEISITLDPTTDPTDAEYEDEYQRILAVLYQAITDCQQAISATEQAVRDVYAAGRAADAAARNALSAAEDADDAADLAIQKASEAEQAARDANAAMNAAKGDYSSLNERLGAIESGKQDKILDLDAIRAGAQAGSTAYQMPISGIPKTNLNFNVQQSLTKADEAVQPSNLKQVAFTGQYSDLLNPPTKLSDFQDDLQYLVVVADSDPASILS